MQSSQPVTDRTFIARQPILDGSGRVFGYELLYRARETDTSCDEGLREHAALRVLNDAVLTMGLETLTGGLKAFMNVTQQMLVSDYASLLPPSHVVLEVLEGQSLDAATVEACKRLRQKGYTLALDDYVPGTAADALLPHVQFIKVDVLATSPRQRLAIRQAAPKGATLVAEKVETAEVFEQMRAEGYGLFQGYYFCRPVTYAAGTLPSRHLAYARLLTALNRPDVSVSTLEDLVKHDASLSYRVLRCINSAAFGIKREVQSIRQALVLMGRDQVRKWASVWAMAGLNGGRTPELVTTAILRARCCEMLGAQVADNIDASEYFLLGLCSLLDVMLGRPMADAVAELPLSQPVRDALLGTRNASRRVLDAVIAYERGLWDDAAELAQLAGLSPLCLPDAYADALKWARELSQASDAA